MAANRVAPNPPLIRPPVAKPPWKAAPPPWKAAPPPWKPPPPPPWKPPPPPPCPPPPPPPPPPPRACASVARRLPASAAVAKIIITRPLINILLRDGRDFPPQGLVRRWRVRGRQMPRR